MNRIWTTDLASHVGEKVQLAGWLHHFRQLRRVSFLVLRDARGLAQIVVENPSLSAMLSALHHESVLKIEGRVAAEPQAPGGVEIHEPGIEVISPAVAESPVDLYRPTMLAQLPTRLDHAPLTLRHPRQQALFRITAAAVAGFRSTLRALGFVEIHSPKIVAAATESGANVFSVDYFGRSAYLAQSPQFYKQIMVGVFERVFEVGPVFRAEPHATPRHLNEYVSLDAEMGFIEDLGTVMETLTDVMRGMLATIAREEPDALATLGITLPSVPATIPRIHFADALDLIYRRTGRDVRAEPDLAPEDERWLGDWARDTFGSDFLFVVGYPMAKRPFYTFPDRTRPGYSNSFDLLFRGLELATGGQRLHLHADYLKALVDRAIDHTQLEWYLEAFKHGMPPHGGFAIGLERFIARLTGTANVRETALFPRDLSRIAP